MRGRASRLEPGKSVPSQPRSLKAAQMRCQRASSRLLCAAFVLGAAASASGAGAISSSATSIPADADATVAETAEGPGARGAEGRGAWREGVG